MLLLLYLSRTVGIGFLEITPNNPQGNWKTVLEEPSSEILDYENILDVINIKENYILLINGKKCIRETILFQKIFLFVDLQVFASKRKPFSFDDLKVTETQEPNLVNGFL